MILDDRLRRFLIIATLIIAIGSMTVIFIFFSLRGNPYGEEVVIKNYKETVKNLSGDYENLIMSSLYQTIKLNLPEGSDIPEVKDATIRDDSAVQTYIDTDNIYRGSFIVDMESLKQSYNVEYSYSNDSTNFALGGYPIIVSCLSVDKLLYGDFNCKDSTTVESEDTDPIIGHLPQATLTYEIRAVTNDDGSIRLIIHLLLTRVDYTTRESVAIEEYKAEALDWIRTQGFDPDNYTIEYVY